MLFVAVGLAFVAIEGRRLQTHVAALGVLPASMDPAAASADLARLTRALDEFVALGARAAVAIARLRAQLAFLDRVVRGFPGPA